MPSFNPTIILGHGREGWLSDDEIDYFACLLHDQFQYEFRETWKFQMSELMNPMNPNQNHIHLIHSFSDEINSTNGWEMQGGHWICTWFNENQIYVYDSGNSRVLHPHHKNALQMLYPHFSVDDHIHFCRVQRQPNLFDCGVFAIAFAVSIAFGDNPEQITYDVSKMRHHLLYMFETRTLSRFPIQAKYVKSSNDMDRASPLHALPDGLYKKHIINCINEQTDGEKEFVQAKLLNDHAQAGIATEKMDVELPEVKHERKVDSHGLKRQIDTKASKIDSKCPKKRRKLKHPALSLSKELMSMISSQKLTDDHMTFFGQLLANHSDYSHQDTIYLQRPERIEPIMINQRHIQILYCNLIKNDRSSGHWICSYYDGKKVNIYDSLNTKYLYDDHKTFLQCLYPFYIINNETVNFITVHQQTNELDCGVFAIAFAVSLLFRDSPERIKYDVSLMRTHLYSMFESGEISRFPHVYNYNLCQDSDLEVIRRKEKTAQRQRQFRSNLHPKIATNSNTSEFSVSQVRSLHNADFNEMIGPNNDAQEKNTQTNSIFTSEMLETEKKDRCKSGINIDIDDMPNQTNIPFVIPNEAKRNRKLEVIQETSEKLNHKNIRVKGNKKGRNAKVSSASRKSSSKNESSKLNLEIKSQYQNVQMKFSIEECIEKLTNAMTTEFKEAAESRIEAAKIIKWCMERRKSLVKTLNRLTKSLKNTADSYLTMVKTNERDDYILNLCGKSRHTSSTEAYFYETTYSFEDLKFCTIVMNLQGQAINVLPLVAHKNIKSMWSCSVYCQVMENEDVLQNYERLLHELAEKTLRTYPKFLERTFFRHREDKLGHPAHCYIEQCPCQSLLLAAKMLAPHFPAVRNVIRLLYKVKQNFNDIGIIDNALETANWNVLKPISDDMKRIGQSFESSTIVDDYLNEDWIQQNCKNAFIALNKRSMDVPEHSCISCQKLQCKRSVRSIGRLRSEISNPCWKDLLKFIEVNKEYASEYICDYCLNKFRSNRLPPTCILNGLDVKDVPLEISTLNSYEKILIQRAKVFQVVQRSGTVMKKNIPHTSKIQRLKGQTFHLPLPLEETLNKIASTTDAINEHHELYILVRGVPTKAKTTWQKLVSLDKVFKALKWLQNNNPLYSNINLPKSAEDLMALLTKNDVEFQVEPQEGEEEKDECDNVQHDGNIDEGNEMEEGISKSIDPKVRDDNGTEKTSNIDCNNASPMVTQVQDDALHSEQYTVYPMNDKRINETACNIYQMKKVKTTPLNYNAENLDLLCFPDLYPYGVNGQWDFRNETLIDAEYIKLRLCSKDSRFRLNQQYLFYLLNNTNIRQINSGIYHTMHVTNPRQKYTAYTYLDRIQKGDIETNMNTIFERLRNSEQYWRIPRNNLTCMARHYGPATWFLTLSPAEWFWSDLILYVRRVNSPNLDKLSESEVIAADPVSVSRFIDNKFHAMLDFLTSDSHPIGKIQHYFWRREYQGRGVQHFHCVIWVENAPTVGIQSNEEVAAFIMKYVTCKLPNSNISPILYRRVTTHQKHKHNSYCLRSKKLRSGKITKVCRFGFPRPVSESFVLRDPAVSIAGRKKLQAKSRFYDLPRSEAEIDINDYNPAILVAWEGNMDIQFIGESSSLLTQYCTKYSTKYETAKSSTVIQEAASTKTIRQKLWNLGMRGLHNRELGALEAADTLLGISLYGTDPDTTLKWIDVRQVRSRKVKDYVQIKNMDANSTDIFCKSYVDDYYPQRPEKLESLSLYDFCKWFDIVKSAPKIKGVEYYFLKPSMFLRKRAKPHLINHWRYNVRTQPENFFYALLFLFKPWRDTDELRNGFASYTDAFEQQKDILSKACEYHNHLDDFQRGLDFITEKINDELNKEHSTCDSQLAAPQMQCEPREAKAAMQEFQDIDDQVAKTTDLPNMISQMNADQRRIFDKVTQTLTSGNETLRLYVSGEGGTGKSFLIDVIRTWISKEMNRKTAVTAPTGIAAFNINGLTIHRYFQLPIEHGSTPKYKQLSDNVLKLMREEMSDVELIIIDEISMVSNVTLLYINQRLMEIFDTFDKVDGWFGKKNILVFGDLLQLPPVLQDPTYIQLPLKEIEKRLGSMISVNLWVDLFAYDELTINMRQKTDSVYGNLLSRLRIGHMTDEDIKLLESRKCSIRNAPVSHRQQFLVEWINSLPVDTVCLLATRKQCDHMNALMLQEIASDEIILTAEDSIDCRDRRFYNSALKILEKIERDDRSSAGLAKHITIKLGAKVMLRRNIDVSIGLVNGTIAVVESISKSVTKGKDHIRAITLKIASGQTYDIERMDVKFEIMDGVYITRKQFPICLSYGITIHKSQGLSLRNAAMDIGNTVFSAGQSYVALSRATTLEGIHLINFDPSSIKASPVAIDEYNRLRKLYRSDLPALVSKFRYWPKVCDTRWVLETGVIDDIETENKKTDLKTSVVGLSNFNGASSFANTIIQCLFHSPVMHCALSSIQDDGFVEIRTFLEQYTEGPRSLNPIKLLESIGNQFVCTTEQDPILFLEAVFEKIIEMRKLAGIEITHLDRCTSCEYIITSKESSFMITLSTNNTKKAIDLNELIEQTFRKWNDITQYCDNCKDCVKFSRKTSVNSTSDVLIVKLNIFNVNEKNMKQKIQNWKLKTVPTTSVALSSKLYSVNSAIMHNAAQCDHYTCLLRDNKNDWIHVDDEVVGKIRWPRNAKDVYVLFLERIDKK